ncbi:GIY-YIG nuclease family protein [Kosakonia sp. BK9b]
MGRKKYYLYALELEDGCYYVGSTTFVDRRFAQHMAGKGAEWTRLHRPVRVLETVPVMVDNTSQLVWLETEKTLDYMKQYGHARVRGGKLVDVSGESEYFWRYLRKAGVAPTIPQLIMSHGTPAQVPDDMWNLVRVTKNDPYRKITSFFQLRYLLKEQGYVFDYWPYESEAENKALARWVLRGYSPAFAFFIKERHKTKPEPGR